MTVHRAPTDGALTPCCRVTPFELPVRDRITSDARAVTCGNPVVVVAASVMEAAAAARQRNLPDFEWVTLKDAAQLDSSTPIRVLLTVGAHRRPDADDIMAAMNTLQLRGLLRYV